jgi:hypothetical protein
MKLRFPIAIVGYTLLTFLPFNVLPAHARDFGTNRKPQTCASKSAPKTGAISAEQAKVYITCSEEGDRVSKISGAIHFIDILWLEVDPKPRRAGYDDTIHGKIDVEKPIYRLKGSVVSYTCYGIDSAASSHKPGKNCIVRRVPKSIGLCFKDVFGDWDCRIGTYADGERNMPPPN